MMTVEFERLLIVTSRKAFTHPFIHLIKITSDTYQQNILPDLICALIFVDFFSVVLLYFIVYQNIKTACSILKSVFRSIYSSD